MKRSFFVYKMKAVKYLISFMMLFLCFSCATTKGAGKNSSDHREEFAEKKLSNGIPVIFRKNHGSKIIVFKMIFEGGNSVLDEKYGGLEALTLDLLMRGSEKYPYSKIKELEYDKSIFLSAGAGRDYSTAGFTCIQRDMALSLDLLSECILNPSFLESDYTKKESAIKDSIVERKNNPSGALGLAISKEVFKGHPYATTGFVTEESFPNISLSLIKKNHKNLLNANRIKIVLVGDFNEDLMNDFLKVTEEKFGKIEKSPFSLPDIPELKIEKGRKLIANELAGETGYLAGVFEYPSRTSSECIPLAISLMYLDDILFSQVREKAGSVYSINTDVIGGKDLLGVLSVYKASEKENLKDQIYNAILSFDESDIEKKLDQYKNRYISTLFSSSQTASGLAASVIFSIEYFGSGEASFNRVDLVQKTSKKEVVDAYKKYIEPIAKEDKIHWFIVDGKKNLDKYKF